MPWSLPCESSQMTKRGRKYLRRLFLLVLSVGAVIFYLNRRSIGIIVSNTFQGKPKSLCEGNDFQGKVRQFLPPKTVSDVGDIVDKHSGKSCKRLWEPGMSAWFDSRFNGSIDAVWNRRNMVLNEDIAKWWLSIHNDGNQNISSLLNTVFKLIPDDNPYRQRNTERCVRCAVVGNSGNLRNSKYGKLIDSHHRVIRVNQAPIEGYEEDVGTKETHRLAYPVSFSEVKKGAHFVMVPFGTKDVEWLISALTVGNITRTYLPVHRYIDVDRSKVHIFNPELMYHIKSIWIREKNCWPSTGVLMILFSLHICDEVDVFGFGASSYGAWDHYWEADAGPWNFFYQMISPHKKSYEETVLEMLNDANKIKIYRGVR